MNFTHLNGKHQKIILTTHVSKCEIHYFSYIEHILSFGCFSDESGMNLIKMLCNEL